MKTKAQHREREQQRLRRQRLERERRWAMGRPSVGRIVMAKYKLSTHKRTRIQHLQDLVASGRVVFRDIGSPAQVPELVGDMLGAIAFDSYREIGLDKCEFDAAVMRAIDLSIAAIPAEQSALDTWANEGGQ